MNNTSTGKAGCMKALVKDEDGTVNPTPVPMDPGHKYSPASSGKQWDTRPPVPGAKDPGDKATPIYPPDHELSQTETSVYGTTPIVVMGRQPTFSDGNPSDGNPSDQRENPFMTPAAADAAGIPPLAGAADRVEEAPATPDPRFASRQVDRSAQGIISPKPDSLR